MRIEGNVRVSDIRGDNRGVNDRVVDGLRKRLETLVRYPESSPREIGSIVRSLKFAMELALIERQIALADQKLSGKASGSDMIELTEEAERRVLQRKADRTSS